MTKYSTDVELDENWTIVLAGTPASGLVEQLGDKVPESSRTVLAATLTGLTELARHDDVTQAGVMLPEPPIDSVVAYAECRWYGLAATGLGDSAKQAYRALSSGSVSLPHGWRVASGLGNAGTAVRRLARPPQLDWQDVDRVTLPVGEAVRVRDLDLQPEPTELVAHLVPVPELGRGVAVLVSWARLHGMRPFGGPVHEHLYDSAAPDSSRGLTLHADSLAESLRIDA